MATVVHQPKSPVLSSSAQASRQGTIMSAAGDEAVPDTDPTKTAGLLAQRLQAWRHAAVYLQDYIEAVEKVHKSQAKEYEKVLKTISKPLKEGQHFDQNLGGIAGFFENMRVNTQALVNTSVETEKSIKGSVLPVLERLNKEIKNKSKELSHGTQKSVKEVEKSRSATQKHIELLGQNTAAFESTGGKMNTAMDDPYVVRRGVLHRLSHQVLEENNHRNDLIAVQNNFQAFEAHVVSVMQQAMEALNAFAGAQAEKTRALYSDMLGTAQRVPPNFEWKQFVARSGDTLVDPREDPRTVESIQFPNMDHRAARPLIEGSLERKSRNKLSWGTQTGYYVVTPAKFLHEFKDSDVNGRHDPTPELSIYLPDAMIGTPSGAKFNIKGKDKAKTLSSKLAGSSELAFTAHSPADAMKWYEIIRNVAGAAGPTDAAALMSPPESPEPTTAAEKPEPAVAPISTAPAGGQHAEQQSGVMGSEEMASPTATSPTSPTAAKQSPTTAHNTTGTAETAPTALGTTQAPVVEEKPAVKEA